MLDRKPRPSTIAAGIALALALGLAAPAMAEEARVPIPLQADLLFLIAGHDRNLPARAGGQVRTLVVTKATDESVRVAAQFMAAARAKRALAGLPHSEEIARYTSPAALAEACRTERIAIVFLACGFSDAEARAIGHALDGTSVLTVAAVPSTARHGVVLGFDLVSGRVKLLIDRARAARQRVAFGADVLGLMAGPP